MDKQHHEVGGLKPQEEVIDLEQFTKEDKKPPEGKRYKVRIGDQHHVFETQVVTGQEIMEKTGITHPECFWLYQKLKGQDFEKIDPSEKVNLAKPGIEHFIVKPTEVFHYSVDDEPETTDQKELTPNQILADAGITPVKDYYLVRVNSDGTQQSYVNAGDTPVKMVCPAVRFISVFRGETPVS